MTEKIVQVLAVDDDQLWLDEYNEISKDTLLALSAVKALELLSENQITHLIVDGLKGQWVKVVEAAKTAGVGHIVLVSANDVSKQAEKMGIAYVDKENFGLGEIEFKDLLKIAEGLI